MNSPDDLRAVFAADALQAHSHPPTAHDTPAPSLQPGSTRGPGWRQPPGVAGLGAGLSVTVSPQALPSPYWVARNLTLAGELGLDRWLDSDAALATLSGQVAADAPAPLATVYSGHQFGVWAGQLGDGRAHLLGEIDSPLGPMELQLKGCGLTPFSRMGDGRAVLRSSIREYLCSEAMHGLGIPTTRALALIGSPLPVRRERAETAAVVTRVAPSFIRFGHFEHVTHTARDPRALADLSHGLIATHYADLQGRPQPTLALLAEVARRTGELMAAWQAVGFCHGVMNTDNMSMLGLTIDYGPFGFLDGYDPGHICNHSDHQGRYAFARQPQVAFWNLHALAQALLPQIATELGEPAEGDAPGDAAVEALEVYRDTFASAIQRRMCAKLGLRPLGPELSEPAGADSALVQDWLQLLAAGRVDHTVAMRRLCDFSTTPGASHEALRDFFLDRASFDAWATRYSERLALETSVDAERRAAMRAVNPVYILRNHLADIAIRKAEGGDHDEVTRLATLLARPFDDQPGFEAYGAMAPDWASTLEISCSS